jgi:ATP-dependent Clp protease protease subunit
MMARISKDWVDAYFAYGVDVANRKVFLFDDVDSNSIGAVIKGLYLMEAQTDKKPIELFVGSFGGSEYDMFALYDVCRTLVSPIHTTAIGKCMSAAPLLVAGGEEGHRYATPNTMFMVHEAWEDFGAKRMDELKIDLKHYDELAYRWGKLMEKHSKKSSKFWLDLCKKAGDTYFNAEKALEWGLIDHIWDEKE